VPRRRTWMSSTFVDGLPYTPSGGVSATGLGGTHKPGVVEPSRMYDVLIPVDQSEARATAQAKAVTELPAAGSEVHATVMHIFQDNPSGASVNQVGSVRRATEALEAADVEYSLVEESGDPAAEIVDRADELDADCICVAGRKRSPTGKALFGSVSQSVIIETDRSVLFAHVDED
jgi:nucleotide-binding universal stress UspA family protein